MTALLEDGFARLEYEQASLDWRHRDTLTWQLPTALFAISTFVVTQVLGPDGPKEDWIKTVAVGGAAFLGFILSVALYQNLDLQKKSRELIKRLHTDFKGSSELMKNETDRYSFCRVGSCLFTGFSWLITLLLSALCGWMLWT